jgi:hypothetical protein
MSRCTGSGSWLAAKANAHGEPLIEDPAITTRTVVAGAVRMLRREPRRILLGVVLVAAPIAVVSVELERWSDEIRAAHHGNILVFAAGVSAMAAVIGALGQVFLAGFLDQLAGATHRDEPISPLGDVFRHLPYVRLFLADLLVVMAMLLGTILFVVPSFFALAYFGIAGPVVIAEDRGPVASLRRSAQLIHGHLRLAFAVIVVPIVVEELLTEWALDQVHPYGYLALGVLTVGLTITIDTAVALLQVVLGNGLIRRDRAPTTAAS